MIYIDSHLPYPDDPEFITILEKMIQDDIDITARAVIRQHSVLKAASSITRSKERSEIMGYYKNKQNELRTWYNRLGKKSIDNTAKVIVEKDIRIAELQHQVEILTASHIAMIRAVGELGGFAKWAKFFGDYRSIIDQLNTLRAIPNQFDPDDSSSI